MAAALRVQHGTEWTIPVMHSMGITSGLEQLEKLTNRRKWKHDLDSARKVSLKYKKQRLEVRYGTSVADSSPDSSYGSMPAEKDLDQDELLRLCRERLQRMKMSVEEINDIIKGTTDQAEDDSGEWFVLRQECVTASLFGEIIKRRSSFVPLVKKIRYKNKFPQTAAMRYGHENEPIAREAYAAKLQVEHHSGVVVTRTGFHIDHLVCTADNQHFNTHIPTHGYFMCNHIVFYYE